MDYEGKSLLEAQADPQTAINTAAIILLASEVEKLEQFCRVEGITLLPNHSRPALFHRSRCFRVSMAIFTKMGMCKQTLRPCSRTM